MLVLRKKKYACITQVSWLQVFVTIIIPTVRNVFPSDKIARKMIQFSLGVGDRSQMILVLEEANRILVLEEKRIVV